MFLLLLDRVNRISLLGSRTTTQHISPVDFNASSETTPLPITFAVAFTKDINLLARSLSHKYKGVSLEDLLLFLVKVPSLLSLAIEVTSFHVS